MLTVCWRVCWLFLLKFYKKSPTIFTDNEG
nr:MAG TPA: hypothetical protein [Caudoviricetes sp.]